MITQCSIRHLYLLSPSEHPHKDVAINLAKTFERRRCNHHELPDPLSEKECMESVVVHNGENKHRYCVATQAPEIRRDLRAVPGVPLVYINRSVMIMEPMAPISAMKREREERGKFVVGIKDTRPKPVKRKREEGGEEKEGGEAEEKKKKKRKGPKGPNPLSVKKRKKPEKPEASPEGEGVKHQEEAGVGAGRSKTKAEGDEQAQAQAQAEGDGEVRAKKAKRKRRRVGKSSSGDGGDGAAGGSTDGLTPTIPPQTGGDGSEATVSP